ncbi:MAG: iron-siderophore ABC transporter substrate-binding protein [Phormidesmis sp.]
MLGALIFVGISACQRQGAELTGSPSTDCRPIEHIAGTTCVPDQIERLVTLDAVSFENAIALGLKPIGTVDRQTSALYTADQLADVVDIGKSGEPNLESIVALKPDLILGLDYQQTLYEQTSQIAPTVLISFEHSGQWKETFEAYSQVLGREAVGQQVMADYRERSQAFQQRLDTLSPSPIQASIVRIYPDSINLYFRESFPGVVLQDAGLARPKFQDISAAAAQQRYQNPIQAAISLESLAQADGDVLFVWTSENTAEANETAQKKLKDLRNDPLWQSLKVVQADNVHFVPSYWIGSGPIAANAILDDLEKYLVEDV